MDRLVFYHAATHFLLGCVPKYDLQMFGGLETQSLKRGSCVQRGCEGACSLSKATFKINSSHIPVFNFQKETGSAVSEPDNKELLREGAISVMDRFRFRANFIFTSQIQLTGLRSS